MTKELAMCVFSCVRLFLILWTVARQASLSMRLSRKKCWNGLPFSPPGDLPDIGVEPASPAFVGGFSNPEPPGKHQELRRTHKL